jgi:hypothetical protein
MASLTKGPLPDKMYTVHSKGIYEYESFAVRQATKNTSHRPARTTKPSSPVRHGPPVGTTIL